MIFENLGDLIKIGDIFLKIISAIVDEQLIRRQDD